MSSKVENSIQLMMLSVWVSEYVCVCVLTLSFYKNQEVKNESEKEKTKAKCNLRDKQLHLSWEMEKKYPSWPDQRIISSLLEVI